MSTAIEKAFWKRGSSQFRRSSKLLARCQPTTICFLTVGSAWLD